MIMVDEDPDVNEFGRVYRNERGQIVWWASATPNDGYYVPPHMDSLGVGGFYLPDHNEHGEVVSYTRWWPPADD